MDPHRIGGFATVFGGARRPHRDRGAGARAAGGARRPGPARRARGPATQWSSTDRRDASSSTRRPRRSRTTAGARTSSRASGASLARLRRLPAVTRDGVEITPRSQSRTADRARAGAGRRRDGAGPRAHRVPLHEPRRSAGRGRAVRVFRQPGARHGGRPVTVRTLDVGGDKIAAVAGPLRGARGGQPGARAAGDPPVAAGAPAAGPAARRDAAGRQSRGRCASCCR